MRLPHDKTLTPQAYRLWMLMAAVFMWFDLEWCMMTSFTALSMPETWVNAMLLATLLSAPLFIFRAPRLQAALVTLAALWMEANLIYYRTYFNAIPLRSYLLAGNLGDFTASVADSVRWPDAGFAVIVAAAWVSACRKTKRPLARAARAWCVIMAALAAVSGILIAGRGGYARAWEELGSANRHVARVPMYTVAGWLIHDTTTSLAPLTDSDRSTVREWIASAPPAPSLGNGAVPRRNLVIILCESLESWVIGLEVEGREVTPVLNALVADTLCNYYAPNILTQVAAGRSIDGQLLVNTGLRPMLSGVYAMSCVGNHYPSIIKAMRPDRSYLLTVDKPVTWNQAAVARSFGIDTLLTRDSWVNDEKVGAKRKLGDRSFMRQAAARMASGAIWPAGERAYVMMVTYSGHNPFVLPDSLDNLRLTGEYAPRIRDYLTMARYTDTAIGIMLAYLRSRPDWDETLVVITGDHEGLADYRAEAARRHQWVSAGQYTPFIAVNSPVAGLNNAVAGQADIYTTMLQMMGLGSYGWRGTGMSLLDPRRPAIAFDPSGVMHGDSAGADTRLVEHLRRARRVSDLIISHDLLAP